MPPIARRLLSCLMLALAGCASAGGSWVELGGHRYGVEIADDDAERERGLMFRKSLGPNEGIGAGLK